MHLQNTTIYIPAFNPALDRASRILADRGVGVVTEPSSAVTHLLLPVPSFDAAGQIRGGGDPEAVLHRLPRSVTVLGGNLLHPALAEYPSEDLLQDPDYVAGNAAITAHCAIGEILNRLPVTVDGQQILIIGWGRIGKCLGRLLRGLDAAVTIAARKESDRALARALGYPALDPVAPELELSRFRIIVNTAPAPVLTAAQVLTCGPDTLKIELSSQTGIPGPDVVAARGLPARQAPESSGNLIADTVCRLLQKECAL